MPTVDARLASLRKFLESHASGETVFIVEGGGEFHTSKIHFPTCCSTAHIPMTGGALSFIRTR